MGHVYFALSRPLNACRLASRAVCRTLVCVDAFSTLPEVSPRVSEESSPMETISDVSTKPIVGNSPYIQPIQMTYTQNGKKKTWDVIVSHDSVAILIHNTTRDVFVFVRQFRPAVYLSSARSLGLSESDLKGDALPPSAGFTYELCAGLIDKRKSVAEIAVEELFEECGYKITEDCLEEITKCRTSVGISGSEQTLYYARVTDSMKVGKGGGNPDEGELIEVVEVPVADGLAFVMDKTKERPIGMMFALIWFHNFKRSTNVEKNCPKKC